MTCRVVSEQSDDYGLPRCVDQCIVCNQAECVVYCNPTVTYISLGQGAHLIYSALGLRKTYTAYLGQHHVQGFSALEMFVLCGGTQVCKPGGHTCGPPLPFSHFW